jgi:hypothetical protein
MDDNPYQPPNSDATNTRSSIPGRAAVLAIHFGLLIGMVVVCGPLLGMIVGVKRDSGLMETDLTGLTDLNRSFANYFFIPVMLMLMIDLPVYILARILKGRPARWHWLRWTTALIPVVVIVYWLLLWRPLIRIPYPI